MVQATRTASGRGTHSRVGVAPDALGEQEVRALAGRLRALRLARGLTQWAIAERGLSYKYYQRIESGRVNVTIRTLARVARALGVSVPELFRSPIETSAPARCRGEKARRGRPGDRRWQRQS